MAKMIVVDVDKCTGCGVCELACSFEHHDEFNPTKSRIHTNLFWKEEIAIPVFCPQCEEPMCEKVCPTGAITTEREPNSRATLVSVSEEKCVGCKMCMLACPFGNVLVSDNGFAEKCDLCGGDPECVKFCLRGALKFVEPDENMLAKKEKTARSVLDSYWEVEV